MQVEIEVKKEYSIELDRSEIEDALIAYMKERNTDLTDIPNEVFVFSDDWTTCTVEFIE